VTVLHLDPEVNALYLEIQDGDVHRTIELAEGVYVDADESYRALGLEFIDVELMQEFLRNRDGDFTIPEGKELETLYHQQKQRVEAEALSAPGEGPSEAQRCARVRECITNLIKESIRRSRGEI
jgi:uncharacterized protein YuzE